MNAGIRGYQEQVTNELLLSKFRQMGMHVNTCNVLLTKCVVNDNFHSVTNKSSLEKIAKRECLRRSL